MSIMPDERPASVFAAPKPPPSWVEWCERNSKPKCIRIVRERVVPTRWQTPGPMKKPDWKYFYEWAGKRAMPKELPEPPPRKIPCLKKYLPCARKPKTPDWDEFAQKMIYLSTPLDRKRSEKHQYVYPVHPYSPIIVWGQPPLHDKGRPFDPPKVPKCFPNEDIEGKFWAELRFAVRKPALKARISPRILSISKPKVMPPYPPHCIIPEHVYDVLDVPPPPRKKFTSQGWRLHQIRLLYLSKPVTRPEYEYFYM
ncbi:uncharacterized protein [Drosophila bipectinata]|uniref:uncharacterized protein n=1 Tax=Drosophila bipectinata TaxID=42026 RepID=UPI001C894B69|nr:uncharacterized protein LOC108129652 [Drosophila bipectinata]